MTIFKNSTGRYHCFLKSAHDIDGTPWSRAPSFPYLFTFLPPRSPRLIGPIVPPVGHHATQTYKHPNDWTMAPPYNITSEGGEGGSPNYNYFIFHTYIFICIVQVGTLCSKQTIRCIQLSYLEDQRNLKIYKTTIKQKTKETLLEVPLPCTIPVLYRDTKTRVETTHRRS